MKVHVPNAMMTLALRGDREQGDAIDFVLDVAPGDFPEFSTTATPRLVFEPHRPTMVGWRWDRGPDLDPHGTGERHGSQEPSPLKFEFRPGVNNSVWALFPERESTYRVEAEIDLEGPTVWFPLPTGRCVHSLSRELELSSWYPLAQFVTDWLFDNTPDTCEFAVDFGQSVSTEHGVDVVFNDEDAPDEEYKSMHVLIPKDLLHDPIANGSEDLAHGFNPWNEKQGARIIAYLNPRLPRLIGFFETTANSDRETQRYASEDYEDGMMPYVPTPQWISD